MNDTTCEIDKNQLSHISFSNNNSGISESHTTVQIDKMNQGLITTAKSSNNNQIDHESNRYPNCIVWTPLPLIT